MGNRTDTGRVVTDTPDGRVAAGTAAPIAARHADHSSVVADRGMLADAGTALALLTGLWVAISPWFLVLQKPAMGNATANDLIAGLAVAAIAMFALSGAHGFRSLHIGALGLGVWTIISPFILDAKFNIAASMYWSNIISGALIAVLALAALATTRPVRAV
jgi:hypothetical protein